MYKGLVATMRVENSLFRNAHRTFYGQHKQIHKGVRWEMTQNIHLRSHTVLPFIDDDDYDCMLHSIFVKIVLCEGPAFSLFVFPGKVITQIYANRLWISWRLCECGLRYSILQARFPHPDY